MTAFDILEASLENVQKLIKKVKAENKWHFF